MVVVDARSSLASTRDASLLSIHVCWRVRHARSRCSIVPIQAHAMHRYFQSMLELGLVLRKVLEWIVQVRVYRSLVPNVPSTVTIQIRFLALAQDWAGPGPWKYDIQYPGEDHRGHISPQRAIQVQCTVLKTCYMLGTSICYMLCYAMLCYGICYAMLHAMLWYMLYHRDAIYMLCHAICYAVCYMLCYMLAMTCYAMLYAMPCYMLCYAICYDL